MARKRRSLVRDAFHHVAVARDHPAAVVHQTVTEGRIHRALGNAHADRRGDALPERPGRGLDAGAVAVFRVARRGAAELAEALDLAHFHAGIAGQVQQAVKQHRAMAGGEHEPVPVRPVGRAGVVTQIACEQHGRHVRHAHRHARMAGVRLLHGVHRKRAQSIRHGGEVGSGGHGTGRSGIGGIGAGKMPAPDRRRQHSRTAVC